MNYAKAPAICAVLLLTGIPAQAADLNSSIDTHPTVGSEIKRGDDAAFECGLHNIADPLSTSICVSNAVSEDKQRQPNSIPFVVGAFWGECKQQALSVDSSSQLAATNSLAAAELPAAKRALAQAYEVFRHYQKQLDVTDEQLVDALKVDSTEGRQALLRQLRAWKLNPPAY